jgi:uncharacterized protein (DUF885 family)
MRTSRRVAIAIMLVVAATPASSDQQALAAAPPSRPAAPPAWVARSNAHADFAVTLLARFQPEGAGQLGVTSVDDQILDLTPGYRERARKANDDAIAELRKRMADETDPRVRQDLEIMVEAFEDNQAQSRMQEKHFVTYVSVPQLVFFGLRSLLDDQVPAERRKAALARLRRYAGVAPGYAPITELAIARARESMQEPGRLLPFKDELERNLTNSPVLVEGLGSLLKKYGIEGHEAAFGKLKEQVAAHDAWVRAELLPRARTDYRLPAEVYAFGLKATYGVDVPPDELAATARAAFADIQAQMQAIAAQVARQRGLADGDYRAVIRELKKEQLVGEAILPRYQERLRQLEEIIRREKLVTLPRRPARIRLATAAESAQQPAPNMRPPRLLGNTGEQGEFILPLNIPAKDPAQQKTYDDFTFDAAAWTLTAHEARPGHEMQFARLLEGGVSTARAIFAFNSTNVEGWGLYAERIAMPFMPLEGQLISLQHRLMRAARAFCDPDLQAGRMTPEQAKALLTTDVVLSDAMATQEVERYTFRMPGQATSYFYGYTRLNELRAEVEKRMGPAFDARAFHDFVLSQGLLPPALLRKAVMEEFATGKAAS